MPRIRLLASTAMTFALLAIAPSYAAAVADEPEAEITSIVEVDFTTANLEAFDTADHNKDGVLDVADIDATIDAEKIHLKGFIDEQVKETIKGDTVDDATTGLIRQAMETLYLRNLDDIRTGQLAQLKAISGDKRRVTRDELKKWSKDEFARLDTNGDGVLDAEEMAAAEAEAAARDGKAAPDGVPGAVDENGDIVIQPPVSGPGEPGVPTNELPRMNVPPQGDAD